MDKKCCNCNKLYYHTYQFCNWACEFEFMMRLDRSAYYNGKLKYQEFLDELKQRQQKISPYDIKYAGTYPSALKNSLI